MNKEDLKTALQQDARFQLLHANELAEPRTGAEEDFIDFIRTHRVIGYGRMMQMVAAEWTRKAPTEASLCGPKLGDLIDISKEKDSEKK